MRNIQSFARRLAVAAVLCAFAAPLLAPTPAAAWWQRGWGWHAGWGWHPGWGYWHGCCWGPRVVIGVAPQIIAVPPPVVVGRVWVPGYWAGGIWVGGYWR